MADVDDRGKQQKFIPFIMGPVFAIFIFLFFEIAIPLRIYYSFLGGFSAFLLFSKTEDRIWKFITCVFLFFFVPWVIFGISLSNFSVRQISEIFIGAGSYSTLEFIFLAGVSIAFFYALNFIVYRFRYDWLFLSFSAAGSLYLMSLYQSKIISQYLINPQLTVTILFIGAFLMLNGAKDFIFGLAKRKVEKDYGDNNSVPPKKDVYEDLKSNTDLKRDSVVLDAAKSVSDMSSATSTPQRANPATQVSSSRVSFPMDDDLEFSDEVLGFNYKMQDEEGESEDVSAEDDAANAQSSIKSRMLKKDDSNSDDDLSEEFVDDRLDDKDEGSVIAERVSIIDALAGLREGDVSAEAFYNLISKSSVSTVDEAILQTDDSILKNLMTSIDNSDSMIQSVDAIKFDVSSWKANEGTGHVASPVTQPSLQISQSASPVVADVTETFVEDDTLSAKSVSVSADILPSAEYQDFSSVHDDEIGKVDLDSVKRKEYWKSLSLILDDGLIFQMDRAEYDAIVENGVLSTFDDSHSVSTVKAFLNGLLLYDGSSVKAKQALPLLWSLVGSQVTSVNDKGAVAFRYFIDQIADDQLFKECGLSRKHVISRLIFCLIDLDVTKALKRAAEFSNSGILDLSDQDEANTLKEFLDEVFGLFPKISSLEDGRSLNEAFETVLSKAERDFSIYRMMNSEPETVVHNEEENERVAGDRAKGHAMLSSLSSSVRRKFAVLETVLMSVQSFENRISSEAVAQLSENDKPQSMEDNRVFPLLQRLRREALVCVRDLDRVYKDKANLNFIISGSDKSLVSLLNRIRENESTIEEWVLPEAALSESIELKDQEIEALKKEFDENSLFAEKERDILIKRLELNQIEIAVKDLKDSLSARARSDFVLSDPRQSSIRLWYERSSGDDNVSTAFCLAFFHGSNQPWSIKDGTYLHCSSLSTSINIHDFARNCADSQLFGSYEKVFVRIILVGASSFDAKSDRTVYQIDHLMMENGGAIMKTMLEMPSNLGDIVKTEKAISAKTEALV